MRGKVGALRRTARQPGSAGKTWQFSQGAKPHHTLELLLGAEFGSADYGLELLTFALNKRISATRASIGSAAPAPRWPLEGADVGGDAG